MSGATASNRNSIASGYNNTQTLRPLAHKLKLNAAHIRMHATRTHTHIHVECRGRKSRRHRAETATMKSTATQLTHAMHYNSIAVIHNIHNNNRWNYHLTGHKFRRQPLANLYVVEHTSIYTESGVLVSTRLRTTSGCIIIIHYMAVYLYSAETVYHLEFYRNYAFLSANSIHFVPCAAGIVYAGIENTFIHLAIDENTRNRNSSKCHIRTTAKRKTLLWV